MNNKINAIAITLDRSEKTIFQDIRSKRTAANIAATIRLNQAASAI